MIYYKTNRVYLPFGTADLSAVRVGAWQLYKKELFVFSQQQLFTIYKQWSLDSG